MTLIFVEPVFPTSVFFCSCTVSLENYPLFFDDFLVNCNIEHPIFIILIIIMNS